MLSLKDQPVPIKVDEYGVARVGGTRVPLEAVVHAFEEGASAEEIVHSYSALKLADVYAVLGYALSHREEVAAYMQQVEREEETARNDIRARTDLALIRERLLARAAERER